VGPRTAGVWWRRDNSGVPESVSPLGLCSSGARHSRGSRPGAPGLHLRLFEAGGRQRSGELETRNWKLEGMVRGEPCTSAAGKVRERT